ncbi:aldo/keto reductase [Streptomyces durbertensis]|uniref:Aldo/keto reductase n=1 Tax=Streptomyces durbertensis TaxID=2448886 RepID=A0ABR6EN99_9ACTN|nr:aldo/keto reductase [Streptomyces durbertensis]MBB1246713.1 aldo/keto reductase [Streptomyces durbertensis]
MERRTIGAGALEVAAIGLGCMPMSWGYSASQQRGETSLRALHAALDAGAALAGARPSPAGVPPTLLDTADMYGPFTNELLVGRVLRQRRADAFVSTKVGLLVGDGHVVANGRPGYVRRACDASLRRLQTDVIDLYQLHRADPEVPVEETWGAMADLVRAGKVRALGLCAVGARGGRRPARGGLHDATLAQLRRVQQVFPVSAVQAELSVWSRQALDGLLPWCASRGVGLLAAMPLGNGFLSGRLTPGSGFEPDDVRARHPRFTAEMMAANQPIVAGLRRVAARHGEPTGPEAVTPAQVALAWLLARSPRVIPVPGTKQAGWATENAGAARLRLTPADLAEIDALPPAQDSWV